MKKVVVILFLFIAAHLYINAADYEWGNLKIGGGGYVTGIVIHPKNKDLMYIRTDVGGAYRWNVKTAEWRQMLTWVGPHNSNLIGVDGMALDPNNPDRVYLALGRRINEEGGVYRSEDQGETWKKLFSVEFEGNGRAARWIGECIAVDPLNGRVIYAGTRKKGLWFTNNDGKTWNKVAGVPDGYTGVNPTGVRSVVFDPAQKQNGKSAVIYAGVPGIGVLISTDAGASFSLLEGSPKNPARMQIVSNDLFVTHSSGVACFSKGVWSDISPVAGKNYVALAVDDKDNNKIIAAQRYGAFYNPIFRTSDKGKTWKQINKTASLNVEIPWWSDKRFSSATSAMAFAPDSSATLFYTDWFGIWRTPGIWAESTDWYTLQKGHEETVVLTLVAPPSGAMVYSGVADVSGFRHDRLESYPEKKIYPLNECFSIAVCESKPSDIALLGAKSWEGRETTLVTSGDYGETWTKRSLPDSSVLGIIRISSVDPSKMVYINGKGKAFWSHDTGESWAECKNLPDHLINCINIWSKDELLASDMVDGSFYILKAGLFYTSSDGESWSSKGKIPLSELASGVTTISAVPGVKGEIWVSMDKDGLWKTTDEGNTFYRIPFFKTAKLFSWGAPVTGSKNLTAYCYGISSGKLYLYRSVDMGENWVQLNDDNHQFPGGVKAIAGDRNIFGRIYLGSGGCGVFYGEERKL